MQAKESKESKDHTPIKTSFYICYIGITLALLAGAILIFAMKGHNYIGYLLWGISILVLVFRYLNKHKMKKLRGLLLVCVLLGMGIFLTAEVLVIKEAKTDSKIQADYVIVLGSSVRGSKPSVSLVDRLERAYEYLKENPEVMVILSGGKGSGENISEAEAMRIWLEEKGIEKERLLKENKSTSTEENLMNSFAMIQERGGNVEDGIAIVSSEYHLYRAKKMASNLGAKPYGIAAKTSYPLVKVNYFIREALGVIYMWVF